MKRLVATLSVVFALGVASCDESDGPTPDGGGVVDAAGSKDGGDAAVTPSDGGDASPEAGPAVCKSVPQVNRATLGMVVKPAGMCASMGDLDTLCAFDMTMAAQTRGAVCALAMKAQSDAGLNEATVKTCTIDALKKDIAAASLALSEGCLSCYAQVISCTVAGCEDTCLKMGAASEGCRSCMVAKGCTATFYACTGLPAPATPAPDGGTGDGGTGDGGKLDGAAAEVAVDAPAPDAGVPDAPAADSSTD